MSGSLANARLQQKYRRSASSNHNFHDALDNETPAATSCPSRAHRRV